LPCQQEAEAVFQLSECKESSVQTETQRTTYNTHCSPLLSDQWRQEASVVIFMAALQTALLAALLAAAR